MHIKQTINRALSLLLVLATLLSLIVLPSTAAVEPSHNKSLTAIQRDYQDPIIRADYERWKAARAAKGGRADG